MIEVGADCAIRMLSSKKGTLAVSSFLSGIFLFYLSGFHLLFFIKVLLDTPITSTGLVSKLIEIWFPRMAVSIDI